MADETGFTVLLNVLKVALGVGVMVGAVGGVLWYADKLPAYSPALEQAKQEVTTKSPSNSTPSGDKSWGIAHDSPIRRK